MARKRTSKAKSGPRSGEKRSDIGADVYSWMHSGRVDRIADYARRGRHHAGLSDEQLAEAWKAAQWAMAGDPFSDEIRSAEQDLSSEFELRGKEPPLLEVTDAIDTYVRKIREQAERLKANPAAWKASNEAMLRDIEEFKARRNRSKN